MFPWVMSWNKNHDKLAGWLGLGHGHYQPKINKVKKKIMISLKLWFYIKINHNSNLVAMRDEKWFQIHSFGIGPVYILSMYTKARKPLMIVKV